MKRVLYLSVIVCPILAVTFYQSCLLASKNLHNTMFDKILRAPPRFFDTNPSGAILNRFSKDIGSMDDMLPSAALTTLRVSYENDVSKNHVKVNFHFSFL